MGDRRKAGSAIANTKHDHIMFSSLDNPAFFNQLRTSLRTRFDDEQVQAVKFLLSEADAHGVTDKNQMAYILGTCWHESGFRSIPERRSKKVGSQLWKWQQRYFPQGWYGRGFSQLTWKKNYKKFSPVVGVDLVANPDAVLNPAIGAKILVFGMVNGTFVSAGLYSPTKLSKYFRPNKSPDWIGARAIVNGTFVADEVAQKSVRILSAIVASLPPVS